MPVHFVRGLVGFGGSRHRGDGGSAMKFAALRSQGSAGRFSRHSPNRFPNRFDRRRGRLVGLVLCLVGVFSGGAHGYRFYWSSPDGSLVPKAAAAERWDPALWGPGATLRFFVAADPAWTARWEDDEGETQPPAFEVVEEALPFVTEALAAWSAVGSADIRWETTGVEAGPGIAEDRRNGVTVTDPPTPSSGARPVSGRNGKTRRATSGGRWSATSSWFRQRPPIWVPTRPTTWRR